MRPLYDDGASKAQDGTRDYVLKLDAPPTARRAPLLHVFGGKITTYRRLAEAALAMLAPHLPTRRRQPRRAGPPASGCPAAISRCDGSRRCTRPSPAASPSCPPPPCAGWCAPTAPAPTVLLEGVRGPGDLGRDFGAGLSERELHYLAQHEFARTGDDVLWRRSKLGLLLTPEQAEAVSMAMEALT